VAPKTPNKHTADDSFDTWVEMESKINPGFKEELEREYRNWKKQMKDSPHLLAHDDLALPLEHSR